MNRAELDAILTLTKIDVIEIAEIANEYSRDRTDPWFNVTTKEGVLKIGRRKRVYELDYSRTCKRGEVTAADVTKTDTMVHAWSAGDLVNYLLAWKNLAWSEDFCRVVAKGANSVAEYFTAYGGSQYSNDPVIQSILERIDMTSSELRKMINPITKEETINLWTGRTEVWFTFPKHPA